MDGGRVERGRARREKRTGNEWKEKMGVVTVLMKMGWDGR
jgi:hypothetical protein